MATTFRLIKSETLGFGSSLLSGAGGEGVAVTEKVCWSFPKRLLAITEYSETLVETEMEEELACNHSPVLSPGVIDIFARVGGHSA